MNLPSITLEKKLSVGNILQIVALVLSLGITWGVFTSQVNHARDDVAGLKVDINALKENRFNDNSRLVRMETLLETILRELRDTP